MTRTAVLANGIVLAAEKVPSVESTAIAVLIDRGASDDPKNQCGRTAVLTEMLTRGAGDLDARGIIDLQDSIGFDREIEASHAAIAISGSVLADNLPRAVEIVRSIVTQPRLDADELPPSKDLCLQSIRSTEDSPSEMLMEHLNGRMLPYPCNRPARGKSGEIESLRLTDVRDAAKELSEAGIIAAVAGNLDEDSALAMLRSRFEELTRREIRKKNFTFGTEASSAHVSRPGLSQVQVGLGARTIPAINDDYPKLAILLTVLSSGMTGRLFVEAREKRGLVYAIRAFHSPFFDHGIFYVYAAATKESTAEAIDVIRSEIAALREGISADELSRAKTQLKSSLVMGLESPRTRVGMMATDLYRRERVRDPEEIIASIEGVSLSEINAFAGALPVDEFKLMTYGPDWQ